MADITTNRLFSLAALFFVAALLLAGCDGQQSDGQSGNDGTAPEQNQTQSQ